MTTKKATKPKFGGKKREPSRKKLENGLTPRQNEFTKKYVECGDPIEAVYHAYNPKDNESAKYFIRWLQDLPPVKTQLQYLLRETKAPTKISDTFLAAMDATSQFGGEDTGLPDHNVRLKAAEGAAKILDVYPNKNSGKTEQHNHLHVDLSSVHPAILKYMKDNRGDIPSETEYYRLIDEHSAEE
tara:strand:+ start:26 stop:580 length:555 start_codon:yes stop_codon:yes gene_type:complete